MEKTDARTLTAKTQEELRKRAVKAVLGGMRKAEAARLFEVSQYSVRKWVKAYQGGGVDALKAKKKGRPQTGGKLKPWQAAQIVVTITDKCPEQEKLPFMLWTRNAVRPLINRRYDLSLSLSTTGRLLRKWGFTPQKPLYYAFERDPKAVTKWLQEEYPAIKAQAAKEKAEIHWGDEMGVRSDHTSGRSFGIKGKTPIVNKPGKRFACNMVSSISNSGCQSACKNDPLSASNFDPPLAYLLNRICLFSMAKSITLISGFNNIAVMR